MRYLLGILVVLLLIACSQDVPSVQDTPIQPTISEHTRELYQDALAHGRDPHMFTTVGDCMTANEHFLDPIDAGIYRLGDYEELQPVIEHYAGAFAHESVAAVCGFNSASPSEAIWADPDHCESGETPVECEIRRSSPVIVLIMLGTHDLYYERETFEGYLRDIIDTTLAANTLPVLITFPPHLTYPDQAKAYNESIIVLAYEYDIPLVNLWAALNPLPNHGIAEGEATQLSLPPDGYTTYFTERHLQAGETVHNLVVLQALERLLLLSTVDERMHTVGGGLVRHSVGDQ